MSGRTGTVYVMTDPRNGLIRYVGATLTALSSRLSGHVHAATKGDYFGQEIETPVAVWVREVLEAGLRPVISPLHVVPQADLLVTEQAEIGRHYDDGWPLTNVKDSPGASLYDFDRRQAATRKRIERLSELGGPLLEQARKDLAAITAAAERMEAMREKGRAEREVSDPPNESRWEQSIRALLARENERPEGFFLARSLEQEEIDRLTDILLDIARASALRGVSFKYVIPGTAASLVNAMRRGDLGWGDSVEEAAA